MPEKKTPKIQDVARVAGVSTATVSRALSHPSMVAEATRQLVVEAVARTGYQVNLAASNLRRKRTGTIVVMVPNLGNPFFSRILASIEAVAAQAGFGVLIVDTKQPHAQRQQVFAHIHRARADGLIVLDGLLAQELLAQETLARDRDNAIPPVVFACEWFDSGGFPSVMIDNHYGASLAIRHLHGLGHRRIGHITGPAENVLTQARRRGSEETLRALGLDVRPEWFMDGDFTLESGAAAAAQWLGLAERPSAVFCSSDQMACGFISELHRRGVSVPEDVSVVGFDDIDIAARYIPSLTTVRQPRGKIGAAAAELLIERIRNPEEPLQDKPTHILPVELIVRGSTCPPGSATLPVGRSTPSAPPVPQTGQPDPMPAK